MVKNIPKPELGMGITICVGSDRYAGTIYRISKSGKTFYFEYDYQKDYYYRKFCQARFLRGAWRELSIGMPIILGKREDYRDPSF